MIILFAAPSVTVLSQTLLVCAWGLVPYVDANDTLGEGSLNTLERIKIWGNGFNA